MEKEPLEPYPALRFVTKGLIPTSDSTAAASLADAALLDVIAPAPPPSGNRTADLLVLQERAVRSRPEVARVKTLTASLSRASAE